MRRLSLPIENIKSHYKIVVIGSGYGGGIAASRLARAGQPVCVLERGREFQPGEYPDNEAEVLREAQTDTPAFHAGSRTGLYDFRINDQINVFVGCGLGGTSLVNANVSLPPEKRVFEDARWPAALRSDVDTLLKDGFTRATEMLKPTPYPESYPDLPKMQALQQSAAAMGASFYRPPINVSFEDGTNHAGVEQHKCVLCGDCVTGCNHGAKNTVLMNYLPDARNHGAEIFTQVHVRQLERRDGKWFVHYQIMDSGREAFDAPTMFVTAEIVILSAGSLGSTEILLRSREAGLSISSQIGQRFTGNGDLLGFSYNGDVPIHGIGGRRDAGPTISGIIDLRNQANLDDGYVIEEGSIPGAIASFLPLPLATLSTVQGEMQKLPLPEVIEKKRRELESLVRGPHEGATANTQTYLVMAHDDGDGRMVLKDDRLRIEWPGVNEKPIFKKINTALKRATEPLNGIYVQNPSLLQFAKQGLTTVHPLGGCVMAESAEFGVVNHKGQVFSGSNGSAVYDSLYVSDGAVIPRPLGVNPLLTISALAERSSALIAKDRGWQIDYAFKPVPAQPSVAAAAAMGVRFTETMKGELAGKPFQFILTITTDDLDHMINDARHEARMVGSVIAPGLSSKPLTVTEGVFNLFVVDPDRVDTRNMIYRMKLTSHEGKTYFFHGYKEVHRDTGLDVWDDTTTLFITVYDGPSDTAPLLGKGILKIKAEDFMKQMTTIEVLNAPDNQARLSAMARFGSFFTGPLFEIYGGVVAKPNAFGTHIVPRKKRALRLGAPEVHTVRAADGVELRLTRYKGGSKGPVILAPGFGTSTLAFAIDTIATNFPEYLFASGFDVFLFDYRASPDLPSSRTQFTLDDIATRDYPAAVSRVIEISGARDVQVVAHCVGSMTLLMSLMSGLKGVRSAVCSSLAFYPISPTANEVKAGLDMGSFLSILGMETMTTDFDADNWQDKLGDALLKLAPAKERCNNPVCRRIQMMYGEVFKHAQLNAATHEAVHEMFGVANLSAFKHISLMVRKNQIVDKDGKDAYLPNIERVKTPITFLHGAENRLFYIEGTKKSFRFIAGKNGPEGYLHLTIPNYQHMDLFIGKDAAQDVFPELRLELEKFPAPKTTAAGTI